MLFPFWRLFFIYPYFIYPYSLSVYNGAGETVFELCLGAIIICAALTGFTKWKKCRMLRADGVRAGNGILAHPTNEAVEQLTKRIEKNGLFALPVDWNTIRLIWAFVYASPEVSEERKNALLEQLHRRD